jgi:hypothetical protein
LDRRPGRLGASGRSGACSATAARHGRVNGAVHHAHYLCVSHHDGSSFGNDDHDDGSAHDDHDDARCHFGRILASLGSTPIQQISALRRMEFSLEAYQFGLRPAAPAPMMTPVLQAEAR